MLSGSVSRARMRSSSSNMIYGTLFNGKSLFIQNYQINYTGQETKADDRHLAVFRHHLDQMKVISVLDIDVGLT